jgi:hypothetical protein
MRRVPIAAPLLLALSACTMVDTGSFERYRQTAPIELTLADAPSGSTSLGLVYARKSGLYLLGVLPIVRVTLEDVLDLLVEEARKLSADGVSHLRIEYVPAGLIGLEGVLTFPWTQKLAIHGMAYKKKP